MSYNYKTTIFTLLVSLCTPFILNAQNDTIQTVDTLTEMTNIETTDSLLGTRKSVVYSDFHIDASLAPAINMDNFRLNMANVNIYDLPYSRTANYPNYNRLWLNSGVLFAAGATMLGVLYLLPEDATAWNKKEIKDTPMFERWWKNVKAGPVVDDDSFIFNYILHPYGGAVYFMAARSQGFNMWYSALYCTFISTVFWEYGIEAFMEIPSIQDLLITPIVGSAFGEGFYLLKRHIVSNDHRLFGSKIIGNIMVYLIDPVNEVIGVFAGNNTRKKKSNSQSLEVVCAPYFNPVGINKSVGFNLAIRF